MKFFLSKNLIPILFSIYSLVYFILIMLFTSYSPILFTAYFLVVIMTLMLYKKKFILKKDLLSEFVEIVFVKMYDSPNRKEFFEVVNEIFKILGINTECITVLFNFDKPHYEVLGTNIKGIEKTILKKEKILLSNFIESYKTRLPFVDLKNTTLLPIDVFENSKEIMKKFNSNFLIPIYSPNFDLVGMVLFKSEKVKFSILFYLSQFINIVSTMFKAISENEKKKIIEEDMKIASQIQSKLVPVDYITNNWFESYGIYIPAYNIGGDYLDIIEKNNSFFFAIGDVSGKGVSAALVSIMVKTILNSTEINSNNITKVIKNVNHYIYKWFYDDESILTFLTLFAGNYLPSSRKFYYINAGHIPPILIRSNELILLSSNSRPIGIFEKYNPKREVIEIIKDDILVLYTDGLIEQIDSRGREFGINRLKEILTKLKNANSKEIVEELYKRLKEFSQERIDDDVCILVVKFK